MAVAQHTHWLTPGQMNSFLYVRDVKPWGLVGEVEFPKAIPGFSVTAMSFSSKISAI